MNFEQPYITDKEKNDRKMRYINTFKRAVWENFGFIPKNEETHYIMDWLNRVSTGIRWYGVPNIQTLLNNWELLESTEPSGVFELFTRVMNQVAVEYGNVLSDELLDTQINICWSNINLFPSEATTHRPELSHLTKHDTLLDTKIQHEEFVAVSIVNPWLLYLMSYSLLTTRDIRRIISSEGEI